MDLYAEPFPLKSAKIQLGCVIRTSFLQRNFLEKSAYYIRKLRYILSSRESYVL